MTELAALGLKADSSGIVKATSDLRDLKDAAGGAEKAADSLARGTGRARDASGQLAPAAQRAASETRRLGQEARTTEGALARMATRVQSGVNGALHRMASFAGTAIGKLTALGLAAATAFAMGGAARMADSWTDMQSVVGAAIRDMEAAPALMSDILRLANASYSPLEQTARGFAANVNSLRELGYATQEQLAYTESLNHMLVLNAARGQRAEAVQTALSRAMAVGRLQADGLETVMAGSSEVAEALARELGTTTGELRRMASEGRITGRVIADALIRALEDVRERAGEMPTLIADGFLKIWNGLSAVVGRFDQAAGASAALAGQLNSLAEWLGRVAETDFEAWLRSVYDGLTLLGQIVLVLAATRMPSLAAAFAASGTAAWIKTSALTALNFQLLAYNAGVLVGTARTMAMAGAARVLGAALAFAGGPLGIVAGLATAFGIAVYRIASSLPPAVNGLEATRQAQDALNTALGNFRTGVPGALEEAKNYAREMERTALAAMAAAEGQMAFNEARLQGVSTEWIEAMAAQPGWDSNPMRRVIEEMEEARRQAAEAREMLENARMTLAALAREEGVAVAAGTTTTNALTDAQQSALDQALDLHRTIERRIELARVEARYGRESLAYQAAVLGHEREVMQARVRSLDVSQDIRDSIMRIWEEQQRVTGETRVAAQMLGYFQERALEAYRATLLIEGAQPGDSFMATAMARMRAFAAAAAEAAQATANMTWGTPLTEVTLPGDGRRNRGGGGGTRGSSISEAERQAKAIQDVIKSLEDEIRLIGQSDQARRLHQELQRAGVEAYSREGMAIADLVERLTELERQQQAATRGVQAFGDVLGAAITGGSEAARQAIAQLLSEIARVQMMRGFQMLADRGGGLGGFFGLIGQALTPNARGGVYDSPSLSAYSNGVYNSPQVFAFARGGVFGEAGPEAIMPLTRGRDGKLGVAATGAASRSETQVIVNNYGSQDEVSVQTRRGPDYKEIIEITVAEKMAQGRFDAPMRRYNSKAAKVKY